MALPCGTLPVELLHHSSLFTSASSTLGNIGNTFNVLVGNTDLTGTVVPKIGQESEPEEARVLTLGRARQDWGPSCLWTAPPGAMLHTSRHSTTTTTSRHHYYYYY